MVVLAGVVPRNLSAMRKSVESPIFNHSGACKLVLYQLLTNYIHVYARYHVKYLHKILLYI